MATSSKYVVVTSPLIGCPRVRIIYLSYIPEISKPYEIERLSCGRGENYSKEEMFLKAVTNYWVKKRGIIKGMH